MTFPIPPEVFSDGAAMELLALVERYGNAREAAYWRNARNDADWYTKKITARDMLEQIRQLIDPGNRLAVCPACSQLVKRHGDSIDEHRAGWKKQICDPARTLEVLLEDAQRRAEAAARATSGIFGRR